MKSLLVFTLMVTLFVSTFSVSAQDRKLSPPETVTAITNNGVKVTIDYSRPSIRGRAIGKEIASYGELWRTGANEQTVITVSKAVNIEGHALPAGKYSIWTIPGASEWTVIINRNTTNWGTDYDGPKDVFRFRVKPAKTPAFMEIMKFTVDKNGKVVLTWGNISIAFTVK